MLFKNIGNIQESIKAQLEKSEDVVSKELKTKDKVIEIIYIKTISDETQLQTFLIKPFFEISTPEGFLYYLQSHPKVDAFKSVEQTLDELIRGVAVLFTKGKFSSSIVRWIITNQF